MRWYSDDVILICFFQHVQTGSKQTNQNMYWMMAQVIELLLYVYQWERFGTFYSDKLKRKDTDGNGILAIVRVFWYDFQDLLTILIYGI